MFPGLRVRERDSSSIWDRDRSHAKRTLILTNRRILVLDEADMRKTSIPLEEVETASVASVPAESNGGSTTEATVEVLVRNGSEPKALCWTAGRRDAEVFAQMVRERRNEIERHDPGSRRDLPSAPKTAPDVPAPAETAPDVAPLAKTAPDVPPPAKTGYTVPVFDVDIAETAPAEPLPEGLKFGDSVIPWSDFERITVREPGVMTFTIRLGAPSCRSVPGWVIRVPELGDAEAIWRDFITRQRRDGGRRSVSRGFNAGQPPEAETSV